MQIPTLSPRLAQEGEVGHTIDRCITCVRARPWREGPILLP